MLGEETLNKLESALRNKDDPLAIQRFYEPVHTSINTIAYSLDTLQIDKSVKGREKEDFQAVIDVHVSDGMRDMSLWMECAEESVLSGNLGLWTDSKYFDDEKNKLSSNVQRLLAKIEEDDTGRLGRLRTTVSSVDQKVQIFADLCSEKRKGSTVKVERNGNISEHPRELTGLSAQAWSYEERMDNMPPIDASQFQTLETNIYRFRMKNNKSRASLGNGKSLTFHVNIDGQSITPDKVLFVKILNSGMWSTFETHAKNGYAIFRAECVESFCIVSAPRERDMVVRPEGNRYVHKTDKRVMVDVPEGAVSDNVTYKVKVFPVKTDDMRIRKAMFPEEYKFSSVSKAIYVEGTFMKPVEVHLPLENIDTDGSLDDDDMEYVYFHIKGEVVEVIKDKHIMRRGDSIITSVEAFSMAAVSRMRRGSASTMSSMEIRISYGLIYHCKLLTFVKKVSERYVQIWSELVKKENWKAVERKRVQGQNDLQKVKGSDSPDIFIAEGERVRVNFAGNAIPGKETPKNALLLTFYPIADDNHIFPPLGKNTSGTPFCTISYERDTRGKGHLHTVVIDPWSIKFTNFKKPLDTQRPEYTRQESSQSNKSKAHVTHIPASGKTQAQFAVTPSIRDKKSKDQPSTGNQAATSLTHSTDNSSTKSQLKALPATKNQGFNKSFFLEFLRANDFDDIKDVLLLNGVDCIDVFCSLAKDDFENLGLIFGQVRKCCLAVQKIKENGDAI